MTKAYDNHPSDAVHAPYNAEHLQESAAAWFEETNDYSAYWSQDWDLTEQQEVSARKYARARFAMGLRAEDYNVA